MTPTRTLAVTRAAFDRWLTERPAAARALLAALSLRLRRTDALLADFTFCPLPQRLARRLLDMAEAQRADAEGGTRVAITQTTLASMLGVSREHVNKELNHFARRGVLELGRGRLRLTNVSLLTTIAAGASEHPQAED